MIQRIIKLKSLIMGKEKKKKVNLTEDDFNYNYFINRELRMVR